MDGSGWEEAELWEDLAERNGDAGETLFDLFQSASDGPEIKTTRSSNDTPWKNKKAQKVTQCDIQYEF